MLEKTPFLCHCFVRASRSDRLTSHFELLRFKVYARGEYYLGIAAFTKWSERLDEKKAETGLSPLLFLSSLRGRGCWARVNCDAGSAFSPSSLPTIWPPPQLNIQKKPEGASGDREQSHCHLRFRRPRCRTQVRRKRC